MSKLFSKLFGEHGARNVITLFHEQATPSSQRALAILKQANATASATATEDQASDHHEQNKAQRIEFDLDVTEAAPTQDQLKSILEFLGPHNAGKVIRGAADEADAMKKLQADAKRFERPVTVDWNAGKVVLGAEESEILRLVRAKSDADSA